MNQFVDENIIDYLKKIDNFVIKLSSNNIEIDIITLKKIKNTKKQNRIIFEYNKNIDYIFTYISKLIKTTYNEIEKINS